MPSTGAGSVRCSTTWRKGGRHHGFPDWEADDGSLSIKPVTCPPADVVILEGAYRARPELSDFLSVRVLLKIGDQERRRRLLQREGGHYRADWESRWAEAEDHYFGNVMAPSSFDLVLRS